MTSPERSALLPNVPTMMEAGLPDYQVSAWFGLFAPAGLPPPILERLSAETAAIVRSPEMRKQLSALGADPQFADPAAYSSFVRGEATKWAATVKAAGLAP